MPRLNAGQRHPVRLTLNGRQVAADAEPRMLLCDFLRHVLGATGTHVGCEHGVCGACTVQIDGVPARSCLTLAVQADGADIRTVEGLAPAPGTLSVLQQAFRDHFALQCGFCTPGILMSLDAWLRFHPDAGEAELREVLAGHLCRCTGYAPILRAALAAAQHARDGQQAQSRDRQQPRDAGQKLAAPSQTARDGPQAALQTAQRAREAAGLPAAPRLQEGEDA